LPSAPGALSRSAAASREPISSSAGLHAGWRGESLGPVHSQIGSTRRLTSPSARSEAARESSSSDACGARIGRVEGRSSRRPQDQVLRAFHQGFRKDPNEHFRFLYGAKALQEAGWPRRSDIRSWRRTRTPENSGKGKEKHALLLFLLWDVPDKS
jgi:hypothetical protein